MSARPARDDAALHPVRVLPARGAARRWSASRRGDRPLIARPALVRALGAPGAPPLATLVAPAGYGKTTLLREWETRDPRPFAWLTVAAEDANPGRLAAAVAEAVAVATDDQPARPCVIVLDDAHLLDGDILATLLDVVPSASVLAIASRRKLALPLARLRAEGLVAELGPGELAFSPAECEAVATGARRELAAGAVEALAHRTEGWPIALAFATRGDGAGTDEFGGADPLFAEYVRDEILAELPADVLRFLTCTAVADVLSGPLCARLGERPDAAALLARLARDGLLIPLDRSGRRYRHHRLLAEALRTELHSTDARLAAALHRRAAEWYREAGEVGTALKHAVSAGDDDRAERLIWEDVPAIAATGRYDTLERRLARLGDEQMTRRPRLAVLAAGCALVRGRGDVAAHRLALAARARAAPGQRVACNAGVALVRAALGTGGPAQIGRDAEWAGELLPDGGPGRALAALLAGVACRLRGDAEQAASQFRDGARAAAVSAPLVQTLCLAELAVLALEGANREAAEEDAIRARAQLGRHGLDGVPVAALVLAASAVVRAGRGSIAEARNDFVAGARSVAALTDFAPWYPAEVQIVLTRAALQLDDVEAARTHLASAARTLADRPDWPGLAAGHAAAAAMLDQAAASRRTRSEPMTAAELRILRFLPTHRSFREIGEQTHVSTNTVKTQVHAIYRKLGVACRSDAVAAAARNGLIDS
jgi:LuxR family maltose regulon positive regulatory protein